MNLRNNYVNLGAIIIALRIIISVSSTSYTVLCTIYSFSVRVTIIELITSVAYEYPYLYKYGYTKAFPLTEQTNRKQCRPVRWLCSRYCDRKAAAVSHATATTRAASASAARCDPCGAVVTASGTASPGRAPTSAPRAWDPATSTCGATPPPAAASTRTSMPKEAHTRVSRGSRDDCGYWEALYKLQSMISIHVLSTRLLSICELRFYCNVQISRILVFVYLWSKLS